MKGTLRPGRKAGVLALAVLLLTCVLMAGAVSADKVTVYTYKQLSDNIAGATDDRTIIIAGNISVASGEGFTIEDGWNITLTTDEQDRTISRTGATPANQNGMFTVTNGNLTIQGSGSSKLILDGNCTNYPSNGQPLVWIDGQSTFTLKTGGALINNTVTVTGSGDWDKSSGAVYVHDGTFVMEDGEISGNTADEAGGGVYVNTSGTFVMKNGEIFKNKAKWGGAVAAVMGGTFVMEDGKISDNHVSTYGGGVYLDGALHQFPKFKMSGGKISGNTADLAGDGVYMGGFFLGDPDIFTLSGEGSVDGVNLTSGKVITVTGELTGSVPQVINIEALTLTDGTKVVTFSGVSGEDYVSYFTLADSVGQKVLTYQDDALVLTPAYEVTFDATGGTPTPSPVLVAVNTPVSKPTENPAKTGFTFTGWYTAQSTKWDFNAQVTEDMTLYANWTKDEPVPPSGGSSGDGNMANAYRVLFNDGSTTLSVVTDLSSGDKLSKPETPVKDGYTFAGWYKDSACTQAWDFETGIPGDMTLYAKWTAAGSSGETEATATPTKTQTAVTTPQPTKTQTVVATTSAPQATTAIAVSPTLTQAPAPVAGALFGLLAAGLLLRRRN